MLFFSNDDSLWNIITEIDTQTFAIGEFRILYTFILLINNTIQRLDCLLCFRTRVSCEHPFFVNGIACSESYDAYNNKGLICRTNIFIKANWTRSTFISGLPYTRRHGNFYCEPMLPYLTIVTSKPVSVFVS